jgi:curved DNA-binding protein CbpA
MASADALRVFLQSLDRKSYYDVLRVPRDAAPPAVRDAFQDFALLYHPDRYVDAPVEARDVAAAIFKRGVEAYRCLGRAPTRARYDRALARGRLRIDAHRPSTAPPPPMMRTLETIAQTPRGRQFAAKADRLIAIGKLDDARVQLVSACQDEPFNEPLAERLQILYEALALEPM